MVLRALHVLIIAWGLVVVATSAGAGIEPCIANRVKAAGRKAADVVEAYALNRKAHDPARLAADLSKAQLRFDGSWNAAAGAGGCPPGHDLASVSELVDLRALDLVNAVEGIPKVLVIGIDGAGWEYLDPLRAAGFVPALEGVISAGTRAPLDCETANPEFSCFCPMVWSTIATGHPSSVHGMINNDSEPQDRGVPAIWTVLDASGGTSTLVNYHNTYPPEPEPEFVVTGPGLTALEDEYFTTWSASPAPDPGDPALWTSPALLFEDLRLLPYTGPQPDAWQPFAHDRASTMTLARLLDEHGPSNLTMWMLISPDKSKHLTCNAVVSEPGGPVDGPTLLAQAAGWSGPIEAPAFAWGDAASQYLESNLHAAALLAKDAWDYVLFLSDHTLTSEPQSPVPCHHIRAAAFDGIFSITGPGVRAGNDAERTNVLCVAPLLAYVLKLPIAQDLPCVAGGAFDTLLQDTFTAAHLATHPPQYVSTW
jgi:hypothetical protein